MMCSDTAELPTAGCVGFWTGKDRQIQGRQRHHKIQQPYIGGDCENPHTLGLICSWGLLHVSAIARCQAQVTWRLSLSQDSLTTFITAPLQLCQGLEDTELSRLENTSKTVKSPSTSHAVH